ncbi:MAG: PfkB family carbohydrate kinase [Treponema sp.]|nr:PfkB family carbohydrate kinase [Treponema sp.]
MDSQSFLSVCMSPTLQKILCFDEVMMDRVNRTAKHRLDVAGKGVNITRVLTQLGKKALHLTQLGGQLRPLFLELCAAEALALRWVESSAPIRFCYTLITGSAGDSPGTITELVEESSPVEPGTEDRLMEAYRRALPDHGVVIIAGSKAAGYSDALVPRMVREAKALGRMVILDLRGPDLLNSLEFRPDVVKPNLLEFAQTFAPELMVKNTLAGDPAALKDRTREICRDLCEAYGVRIVLTRGGESLWYADPRGFSEFRPEPVKPVNTTGSGDAFTAGFAAALGEGASPEEAVALGIRCGGLNAGLLQVGTIR